METAAATAIGTTAATAFQTVPVPGSTVGVDSTFTCCPAALSVQLMCPTALQTASGQLAAAVCPVRMALGGTTKTWSDVSSDVVAFFRPRMLTAGKLALRGVQMDSFPLSMAEVSNFLPYRNESDAAASVWSNEVVPRGWAPIVIVNPDTANLSILVSIEWRVRFDISNPAVSSHTHHGVTSDYAWDQHIKRASDALPGVVDIVGKVANLGIAGINGVRALRNAAVAAELM